MGFIKYFHGVEKKSYSLKHCVGQSHAFRKHVHEDYSIALVTGGESLFRFVDEEVVIQTGQLVIIGPDFAHQCIPTCIPEWHFYMLHISPQWLMENGIGIDEMMDFAVIDLQPDEYKKVESYFERACRRSKEADEYIFLIMELALSQKTALEIECPSNHADEQILACIYEEIRARFKEPITLEALALKSGMDRYTLIRKFNKRYNTTPRSWQIMLRVNEARNMLKNGCSLSETALEVGFYDQSHFSKVFKETYGITPKQFTNTMD